MNIERRRKLGNLQQEIDLLVSRAESIKDEEEESYNNMSESLQNSEKGEKSAEALDALDSLVQYLNDSVDAISEAIGR